MKILFDSVFLDREIPRFANGTKGLSNSSTTFFDVSKAGVVIEFDTATQLVRISRDEVSIHIPVSKIDRFGAVITPDPRTNDKTPGYEPQPAKASAA
jgi:hypothetical protein